MTHTIFIDGEAGTTGLEIRERLKGRGELSFISLGEADRKDAAKRKDALNAADLVILCLPDDAAREAVAMIDNPAVKVIDASTAYRVASGWTYGFAELRPGQREAIAESKRVSNPGCYPTGFLGLLAPLVHNGLLPSAWPYTCTGVSGYSGGGKALIKRFEDDRDIAWRGYGLSFGHKHVPEMQRYAGLAIAPLFSPAVVPAHRGMVVEVLLPLGVMPGNVPAELLRAALTQFYGESKIVTVAQDAPADGEMLMRASMEPWDGLKLHVMGSEDGEQARLVAVLDNLGKGASGAAVQTLNLMAGLDETAGLRV